MDSLSLFPYPTRTPRKPGCVSPALEIAALPAVRHFAAPESLFLPLSLSLCLYSPPTTALSTPSVTAWTLLHLLPALCLSITPSSPSISFFPRGQIMAFAVLRLGWNASLFGVALLLTIAFSTADWLVAQDATAARLGYERIALGPAYACIDYAPPLTGQACGAYGWNLADIPHSTWRVGAFFLGVSLLLLWLVWILSLFSFIFPRLHRAAACFVGIAGKCVAANFGDVAERYRETRVCLKSVSLPYGMTLCQQRICASSHVAYFWFPLFLFLHTPTISSLFGHQRLADVGGRPSGSLQ